MSLITITHAIGCNAREIVRRVAEGLDIEVFDDFSLKDTAQRMGLHSEQIGNLQEKPPDWFERALSDRPDIHLQLVQSVVYEAARLGKGVILGHGSQVLLQDFGCAMHVLITSHEEYRIDNLMQQMSISKEDARKLMRRSDSQKKGFFRYAFHKNWDDPALYDLCLNPGKIGLERAAQLIVETARSPEIKACSIYALEALERMSQAKRIEAALIDMDLDLRLSALTVEMPEKGVAHISGILFNREDKERIPAVVGRIPGVERIELDVTLMPAGYD